MAFNFSTAYMKTEPLSTEKQKLGKRYLEDQSNMLISLLVRDNSHIHTARNYYASKRDVIDFQYLEDMYGMSNPISLGFTNIIKPRVDALVGLSILSEPEFSIAYVDKDTIAAAEDEVYRKFIEEVEANTKKYIKKKSAENKKGEQPPKGQGAAEEEESSKFIDTLTKKYGENYESSFATAATDVMDILLNDPDIDMPELKTEVAKDYIITGEAYTRAIHRGKGKKPMVERIPAEQIFTNRPRIDTTLKNTDAVVREQMMRPHQILKKFGNLIKKSDAVELFGRAYSSSGQNSMPNRVPSEINDAYEPGEQMDRSQMETGYSNGGVSAEGTLYPVYHVEWLASTRISDGNGGHVYREDIYEIYRVGIDLYLGGRRCDEAPRRKDEPWKTTLSYRGRVNHVGNGEIVSIVLQMKELQDLYDIIMFFRNNAVATSGVSGSRVNVAAIPKALGKKFMDRLTKWLTIRKNGGVELVDPTEDGAELFQHYGDFNAAVRGDSLNAVNSILESLMVQADIVSGVPRQMLGIIEQRDAVENVKVGVNQVGVLSLEMFRSIDRLMCHSVQDAFDIFKYSYRDKPFEGVKRVGIAAVPVLVQPDKFASADHEVTVVSAGVENSKLLKIQQYAIGTGILDPDTVLAIMSASSVQKAEYIVKVAMEAKRAENDKIQQLQQQLQQATEEAEKLGKEVEKLSKGNSEMDKAKLDVQKARDTKLAANEQRRLDIEEKSIDNTKDYRTKEIALKRATVELEKEQLLRGSGNQKEIKNDLV